MRRLLLSSAALISIMAVPAHAELQVTLGGETAFQAGFMRNAVTNGSDRDFTSETDVTLNAVAKADNGLEYGAHINMMASTSDTTNTDETMVYLQGNWGRVEMGDYDGASDLAVYAPVVGAGQIDGVLQDYIVQSDYVETIGDKGDHNFTALDSFKATKVTFYTPVFRGFQAGVSFAPEFNDNAFGEGVQFNANGSQARNIFELAARYDGDIGPTKLSVSGQYNFGEGTNSGFVSNDLRAWGLGAQLAYKGFTIGGGYTDDGDSLNNAPTTNDNVTSWNAGVTYETGPWGFGVSYLSTDLDQNGSVSGILPSDGQGGTFHLIAGGATYAVAPGLTLGADLGYYERNRFTGADTDGYSLVTEVRAAF